jgi:hypothetical protein
MKVLFNIKLNMFRKNQELGFTEKNFAINTKKKIAMSIVMHILCILYCLLFIPTKAQAYILKYFISTSRCFSASTPPSRRLSFVFAKITNY